MVMISDMAKYDETKKFSRVSIVREGYDWQYLTALLGDENQNWFSGFINSPIHVGGKFRVFFETDLDDGGFVVSIPTLTGCITEAESIEEAYKSIKNALDGWIAVAQEEGLAIPGPDFL